MITFLTIENNNHNIHSFKFMEELVAWLKGQPTCLNVFLPFLVACLFVKAVTGGNGENTGNLVDPS